MENQYGTLIIRAMVCFSPMEGNKRQAAKSVTLETIPNVTKDQARGYWLDFKGMNQDMKHVTGEWVAREVFF